MKPELKSFLQDKLTEKFNYFSTLPNSTIQVMPMAKDIPTVEKAVIDKHKDVFEFILDNSNNFDELKVPGQYSITIYLDKSSKKLVGIKIENFSKLVKDVVEKVVAELKKNSHSWSSKEIPFSYTEVENRKIEFIEDVFTRQPSLYKQFAI